VVETAAKFLKSKVVFGTELLTQQRTGYPTTQNKQID
jgi:hypothetical protein